MKKTNVMLSLAAAIALTACGGGGGGSGGNKSSASVTPSSSSASSVAVSSEPASSVAASSESSVVETSSSVAVISSSLASSSIESSSSVSSSEDSSSSVVSSSSSASSVDFASCDNFNTVQGYASRDNGVTGGADAGLGNNVTTVSTGTQLTAALSTSHATYKDKPLVIYIDGKITWENSNNAEIRIRRSNVSIIGLENSGEFEGVGIRISHGASNILIRNLLMHEVPQSRGAGDHIHLDGQDGAVSNIWIDHNEFYNSLSGDKDFYDELVSGRSAVKNVTISYNYLHDSQKTSLWGSSDDAEENAGRTISFHHNYWKDVVSRLPLFRFGEGHVWNNYYQNVTGSGINSRMGAKMRIDNNVFENVKNPILSADSDEIGYWNATGNNFTGVTWGGTSAANCSTPPCYAVSSDSVTLDYQPPYTYTVMPTAEVKAHVTTHAGRDKIISCLNLPEASSSSSSSSESSSSSSSAVSTSLIAEDFSAADVTTFVSAAYKAIPSDSSLPLYVAVSGSSRMAFANGELSLNNARFTIGDKGGATTSTAQPNGSFDLTKPYRIKFTVTAATGTGNFQVYVDNNTTSSGNSIHTTASSTTVSRLLQMTPTDITSFPYEVVINSDVGTATSFFQIRADSSITNLTIDNLTVEYQ